jgi:hypothetical protein
MRPETRRVVNGAFWKNGLTPWAKQLVGVVKTAI